MKIPLIGRLVKRRLAARALSARVRPPSELPDGSVVELYGKRWEATPRGWCAADGARMSWMSMDYQAGDVILVHLARPGWLRWLLERSS